MEQRLKEASPILQKKHDGIECTVCKLILTTKKTSGIDRHLYSGNHVKMLKLFENIVNGDSSANVLGAVDCYSSYDNGRANIHKHDSIDKQSQSIQGQTSQNTQSTGINNAFQSPRTRTKQQELEDKILFLEAKVKELLSSPERSHFTISDLPSGVGSANRLAQEDCHLQCNRMIADKDKQIAKLEDKLISKENEMIQLKSEQGVTNILQMQLKEKEDENFELKQELIQVKKNFPINPHSQCEQTISLLEAQVESLKAERDIYRTHRDDLARIVGKKVFDVMKQHMNDTNIPESSLQSDESMPNITFDCVGNSNNVDDRTSIAVHNSCAIQSDLQNQDRINDCRNTNSDLGTKEN